MPLFGSLSQCCSCSCPRPHAHVLRSIAEPAAASAPFRPLRRFFVGLPVPPGTRLCDWLGLGPEPSVIARTLVSSGDGTGARSSARDLLSMRSAARFIPAWSRASVMRPWACARVERSEQSRARLKILQSKQGRAESPGAYLRTQVPQQRGALTAARESGVMYANEKDGAANEKLRLESEA